MNLNSSRRQPRPTRLRERMKAVATSSLLDACEAVIAKDGDRAKMEDIARAAGMAVGTVYNYFDDREALIAALRAERKRQLVEALENALTPRDAKFETRLRRFVQAMLAFAEARRPIFALLLASPEARTKVPTPAEAGKEMFALAEKLIRSGVDSGALRSDYGTTHVYVLLSIVRGLATSALHSSGKAPLTDLVEPVIELFLHGAGAHR